MFKEEDIIYSYSSKQAEEDGILINIEKINQTWEKLPINYITINLMNKGYLENYQVKISNLLDLINQTIYIIKEKSKKDKKIESFYAGIIELPNSEKQEIFIQRNETGKFTIMLPEEY